jgi:hypothetical protein
MGKYLLFWKFDRTKIPVDSQGCVKALCEQIEMHNQAVEKGIIKKWGNLFVNTMDI